MDRASLVGSPCQSARGHGRGSSPPSTEGPRILCGLPSNFIWLGIDPLVLHLSAARLKHYKPSTLLLCPDCAMELAHDFAWQIRDGRARLERLDVIFLRISCKSCFAATKVTWDASAPQLNPGMIQYCPRCGHHQVAHIDPEADYWDIMVEAFGSKDSDGNLVPFPRQLLLMLYSEWPRNDRRYHRFADYVADQMAQYDATETFEAAEASQ